MAVDDVLEIDVGGLILGDFLQEAELVLPPLVSEHAELQEAAAAVVAGLVAVLAEREAVAIDIEDLADLVVVVGGRLADLEVEAAGLVLDVDLTVDVAVLVGGSDLSAEDIVLVDLYRGAVGPVEALEFGDGREFRHSEIIEHFLVGPDFIGFAGVAGLREHRLELLFQTLAGYGREKRGDDDC